jgi:hypothetical protein
MKNFGSDESNFGELGFGEFWLKKEGEEMVLCVLGFLLRKEMKLHRSDSASKQLPPFDSITFEIGRFEMKGLVLGLG